MTKIIFKIEHLIWAMMCIVSIFTYTHQMTDTYIVPKWCFTLLVLLFGILIISTKWLFGGTTKVNITFVSYIVINVYTRDCSFEDFCEYILPYQQANGIVIDSARQVFYARHHGKFFTESGRNMTDEVDSLLYLYRNLIHTPFGQKERVLWSAAEFEHYEQGLCEDRCWYNALLLTSLGMAAATDFVPTWGNRNWFGMY